MTADNGVLKVIVDGYNAMGWFGLLEDTKRGIINLEQARRELTEILAGVQRISGKVTVVFDGNGKRKDNRRRRRNGVRMIFTRAEEDADKFIKRFVDCHCVVITNDRELRKDLQEHGTEVFSIEIIPLMFFVYLGDRGNLNNGN